MATLKEWEASLESKRTKQNLKYLKESKLVFDPIRHNATDKSDTTVVYAETGKEDPSKNGMFTYSPATLIIGEISVQKEKYKPRADESFFQGSLFKNLSKEFEVTKYGDYGNSLMSDFVLGIYNSPNFTYDKVEYFEYNKHAFIIWTQNNPTATSDCKENYVCASLYDGMTFGYVCAVAGNNVYVQLYDDHKDNVNRLVAYMLYGSTTKWRDVYPKATTRKFVGGFKPICMPVAPNEEGKQYAAQGDQWVEVKAGGGSEEGALCVKFTIDGAPTVKDKRTILHATANYSKKEILDAFKNNRVVYTDDSTSDVLGTKLILTVNSTGSDYYFSAVDVLKLSDEDEKFNTLVFAPAGSNEDSKDFDIYINSEPFGDFVKDVEDDSGTVYGRKNGEWVEIETGGSGDCNVVMNFDNSETDPESGKVYVYTNDDGLESKGIYAVEEDKKMWYHDNIANPPEDNPIYFAVGDAKGDQASEILNNLFYVGEKDWSNAIDFVYNNSKYAEKLTVEDKVGYELNGAAFWFMQLKPSSSSDKSVFMSLSKNVGENRFCLSLFDSGQGEYSDDFNANIKAKMGFLYDMMIKANHLWTPSFSRGGSLRDIVMPISPNADNKWLASGSSWEKFEEAPKDDKQYGMKNGKWVEIETGGGSGDCNVVVLDTEEKSAEAEASADLNKIYLDRLSKQTRLCCYRNEYIKIGYAYLDNEKKWTILTTKTPTVGTDAEEAYNQLNVHEDYSSKLVATAIKGEYTSGDKWFHSTGASHTRAAESNGRILIMSKLIRGSDDHEVVVFIDYYDYEMRWGVCNYGETFNSFRYGNFTLGEDWDSSVELFEKKIIGYSSSHEVFISTYNSGIRELAMPAAPSRGYYIASGGSWEQFEKAPWDGKQYGMKNGKWTEIEAGGSGEGAFVIAIADQSDEKGQPIFIFNRNLKEIKAAIAKGLPLNLVDNAESPSIEINLSSVIDDDSLVLFCSDAHYSKGSKKTYGGAMTLRPITDDDNETKFEIYNSSFIEDVPEHGNTYIYSRMEGKWEKFAASGVKMMSNPICVISSKNDASLTSANLIPGAIYYVDADDLSIQDVKCSRGFYQAYSVDKSTTKVKPFDGFPGQEVTIKIDVATEALSSGDLEKVNSKYPYVQLYDSNANKMYRFNMAYPSTDLENKFYIFDRHTFTFDQAKMEIAVEGREYLIINGANGEITKKTIK